MVVRDPYLLRTLLKTVKGIIAVPAIDLTLDFI